MFARARTAALTAAAAGLAAKAALLTASDDWDDVAYAARALPRRALTAALGAAPPATRKPRVVVLGSGWGALSFIRKLDQDAVDLTIVSPRPFFFYTPLLAGTATGTVAHGSIVEPIRWYCQRAGHGGARYIQGEVAAIDPAAKQLRCAIPTAPHAAAAAPLALDYDYLVVAVGAEPNTFGIPGVREHTRFLKEVEDGIAIQRDLLQQLEVASALVAAGGAEAEVARLLSWVVIGGGPTGVELTAELMDFVRSDCARYFPALAPRVRVTLVEAAGRVLGVFDPALSAAAAAKLTELGAHLELNTAVTRVVPGEVHYKRMGAAAAAAAASGSSSSSSTGVLPFGTAVWAGGIARRPIVGALAAALDPGGAAQSSRHGLVVDGWCRVAGVGDHSVYAIGDCAVSGAAPTAQAAVQQGRYLGRLFRDSLETAVSEADPSAPMRATRIPPVLPFHYHSRGALAYTGGGTGVAELRSLWDAYPGEVGRSSNVEGRPGFALWRSLYFSSILSTSNMARVLFDWVMAGVFGRDISTPFVVVDGRKGEGGPVGGSKPPALPAA